MKTIRTLLVLVLVAGPVLFAWLVWTPSLRRMKVSRARIEDARTRIQEFPHYDPLTPEEIAHLEDPRAPWRSRIGLVRDDRDRLRQYHRVVTELDRVLAGSGIHATGMRSSWDPIRASFTLGDSLAPAGDPTSPPDPMDGALAAWVLEVQLEGPTATLFQAMEQSQKVTPLLEPAGLRWESTPERRSQSLHLRCLVVRPSNPAPR